MSAKIWFAVILAFACLGFYNLFSGHSEDSAGSIHYVLSVEDQHADFFNVRIAIENPGAERLIFRMPRWAPGAYRIRDYADNVISFAAHNRQGRKLSTQKISEDGWQVISSGNYLMVEYQVEPAYETWSQVPLDTSYALVEGPSVFMYLEGKTNLPITVEYQVPLHWQVACPLKPLPQVHTFHADNYDALVDAPAQLGSFTKFQFELGGAPVELVVHGDIVFKADSFSTMVKKICEYQAKFFNEVPFDRYIFFYKVLPGRGSGGGLEHANSTTIGLAGDRLAENVLSAAEVTAHEFFHVWNVKRIRPRALEDIDYTAEERTGALWFSEGVTSYYEALTLMRAGLWREDDFINEMERQIEGLQENADRHQTSVEEASWNIWDRGYIHSGVSFYNKGELVGMLLDLKMRQVTRNRVCLDDVMRFMNWWFAKEDVGFAENDIRRAVNALTQHDFSDFFAEYVSGTTELPYEEALAFAGLDVSLTTDSVASIGELIFVGPRNRVVYVETGSPVHTAGVRKNDCLLQLQGVDITAFSQLEERVSEFETGMGVEVKVLREGVEMTLPVQVGKKELADCEIEPMKKVTELQLTIRRGWLEGRAGTSPND
ncbi:MAG TPA: PDZ domain-containing protein [bacterium]